MSKGCLKCGALNADDARFCRQCGKALTSSPVDPAVKTDPGDPTRPTSSPPAFALPARRQPLALWASVAALLIALIGGALWWFNSTREPAGPTFDSSPPPSVAGASGVASAPTATESVPASDAARSGAIPGAIGVPTPAADAGSDAPLAQTVTRPGPASAPATAPASHGTASSATPESDRAAREARAQALRERRAKRAQAASQAEAANLANRRAEEARARAAVAVPAPVAAPVTKPAPPTSQARTVQERCGSENLLLRSMCEARECIGREHADEPACVRVKAAEERRRQREGGG